MVGHLYIYIYMAIYCYFDTEELAQEFILQDVHEIIPLMLNIPNQSESVITMGLQALCILTETGN